MVEEAQENDKKNAAKIDAVEELNKTQAAEPKKQKNPNPFGDFGFGGLSSGQKS